jgi:hypothetical protein
MEVKVGGHFKLGKRIGSGSFGEIYSGIGGGGRVGMDMLTNKDVAIKLVQVARACGRS